MVIDFDENGITHIKRGDLEELLAEAYQLGLNREQLQYGELKSHVKIDGKNTKFRATTNEQ